jgi:hypothetical protein
MVSGMTGRRGLPRGGVAVVVLGALLAIALPSGASARTIPCTPYGAHCYSIAYFTTSSRGQLASEGSGYMFLGCLGVPGQTEGNINTDEMWAVKSEGSWIEAGLITGLTNKGDETLPHFFVSYDRKNLSGENAGTNEVIGSEAPVLTANLVTLKQTSPEKSTTWDGWTAGTGTVEVPSFANKYAAVELQTGLETTEETGWNDAAFTGLAYRNWNGTEYTKEWKYGSGVNSESELDEPAKAGLYFVWEKRNYEADFGQNFHGC